MEMATPNTKSWKTDREGVTRAVGVLKPCQHHDERGACKCPRGKNKRGGLFRDPKKTVVPTNENILLQ